MREKQIETDILTWLNYQPGCFAFKVNTVGVWDSAKGRYRTNNNPFVMKGCSDIIGIWKNKFLAIEVKTPQQLKQLEKKPTETWLYQKAFLGKVANNGGIALIAMSLDGVMEGLGVVKN